MLQLTIIAPWDFADKYCGTEGGHILTDSREIKDYFRCTFMHDSFDDMESTSIYDLRREVYRDYLRRFHGSELYTEPFVVENKWIIKSGVMHCLADSIYSDILLGLIIMAESETNKPLLISDINNVALRFLIESKNVYVAYYSCMADFGRLWDIDADVGRSYKTSEKAFLINGNTVSYEYINELANRYKGLTDTILSGFKRYDSRYIYKKKEIPPHCFILSLTNFQRYMDWAPDNDYAAGPDWVVRIYSEALENSTIAKYVSAIVVSKSSNGEYGYNNESIYTNYGGVCNAINKFRIMMDEKKLDSLAVAIFSSDKMLDDAGTLDILKDVSWYIFMDGNMRSVKIWDGHSREGRSLFYEAFLSYEINKMHNELSTLNNL
ncbi:hypothetical protein [Butyrivibrio sp. AC2005]|uniref:hypothetical protein n=1 Tax=Butyrivibrio sp. AC2005 TaxID=1280672 RepID=UPI0003FD52F6|nr:hypothetical protein [Butyrivibrio sp. AC2005]